MNRQQKRELDKQVKKSIQIIQSHLNFLNDRGNPKYKLVKQNETIYKLKRLFRIK